jgi:uncharacterized membrane protein YhaH (DUF805 family)
MSLKQLFTSFDGRINRQTFWIAFGLFVAVSVVAYIVALAIGIWFLWIVALALIYPQVAVGAKRFHDMGKPGMYMLIGLIPFVGGLILLIWLGVVEGDPAENAYGAPMGGQLQMSWS